MRTGQKNFVKRTILDMRSKIEKLEKEYAIIGKNMVTEDRVTI